MQFVRENTNIWTSFQDKKPICSGGFSERLPRPVPHLLVLLCVDHALLPRLPCVLKVVHLFNDFYFWSTLYAQGISPFFIILYFGANCMLKVIHLFYFAKCFERLHPSKMAGLFNTSLFSQAFTILCLTIEHIMLIFQSFFFKTNVTISVYPDAPAPMSSMNPWPSSKRKDAVSSSSSAFS